MSAQGSLTNLNARLSQPTAYTPGSRYSGALPVPGTPRGVHGMSAEDLTADLEKAAADVAEVEARRTKTKRTWYGRKRTVVVEELPEGTPEPRPAMLYAPVYNGFAFALSIFFIGNGINVLLIEWQLDNNFTRFALCAVIPLLFAVSLVSGEHGFGELSADVT